MPSSLASSRDRCPLRRDVTRDNAGLARVTSGAAELAHSAVAGFQHVEHASMHAPTPPSLPLIPLTQPKTTACHFGHLALPESCRTFSIRYPRKRISSVTAARSTSKIPYQYGVFIIARCLTSID